MGAYVCEKVRGLKLWRLHLHSSCLYILRQNLWLYPELSSSASLGSELALGITCLCLPSARITKTLLDKFVVVVVVVVVVWGFPCLLIC